MMKNWKLDSETQDENWNVLEFIEETDKVNNLDAGSIMSDSDPDNALEVPSDFEEDNFDVGSLNLPPGAEVSSSSSDEEQAASNQDKNANETQEVGTNPFCIFIWYSAKMVRVIWGLL